ncbi:LysR family transcriptional regulator [Companilactobacillus furfuricola]|uniref:LysR family transcriptional regulator n=1 Tax=Companilactobacillus furfuricola TaxID=1462575 RepID=UPI000F7B2088|nr:LysR family transcriptional regulator [Companilactobacillus furfuricola]
MNIKHLVYFRELAHTQHMSKAAENLGISQPTLSYSIDNLEKKLGVPLFEHEGRNIKLSRFGEIYLKFVTRGLNEIERGDSILEQLLNVNEGNIRIGFTYSLGQKLIPELIANFKKIDDTAGITFDLFQGSTEYLLRNLFKENYDFVLSSKMEELDHVPIKGKLNYLPIIKQEMVLAVPMHHPLSKFNNVNLKSIESYPLLTYSKNNDFRPIVDLILSEGNIKPRIKCEVEDVQTLLGLVEYDQGIAIVPKQPQLDQTKVKLIHLKNNPIYRQVYMVLKDNRFLTPSLSRFQNFLTRYCKENYKDLGELL